jgi:hypothetical protein
MSEEMRIAAIKAALQLQVNTAWNRGSWLVQQIQAWTEPLLQAAPRGDQGIAPLNTFLNTNPEGDPTAIAARAFTDAMRQRCCVGNEFECCVKASIQAPFYAYLALQFIGHPMAFRLQMLVKMLPFIVPIYATDKEMQRWIVIVP